MSHLYQEIIIWRRLGEKSVTRYVCFLNLATLKYSVQSCDFFNLPLRDSRFLEAQLQAVELFSESLPAERSGEFDSIEAAIHGHDENFADLGPGGPAGN